MPKSIAQPDVLVLGQHPCAYLAALLMLDKPAPLTVTHATIPGDTPPDRLVILNPELFALHKPLEKLKKKLELPPVYGVTFLSDDPSMRGEWRSKSTAAYIGCYSDIRKQLAAMAKEAGAKCMAPKTLSVNRIDEHGFEVAVDSHAVQPKAVLLAGHVTPEQGKGLALPEQFGHDVMRRYSFVRLRGLEKWSKLDPKPMLPMSLDLAGKLTWAWMLPGVDEVQLAIEQPADDVPNNPPPRLMQKWVEILRKHGLLRGDAPQVKVDNLESIDVPAAGALTREIVANRTLLFGPAGGFYSACLEDLYPNCWSAVFAVEAVRQAIKEPHLQDALQPYRQKWGTTLGEYLRGPQQNLRFLLPLVYRNPVMTSRMGESILQGKPVVR